MEGEKLFKCPHCKKKVPLRHFPCFAGAMGGKAKGKCKSRGDSQYYKDLRRKGVDQCGNAVVP